MTKDQALKTLEKISRSFDKGSPEREAIRLGSLAIAELENKATKEAFDDFIRQSSEPLTGYQLLHLMICGVEIPEHTNRPELEELKLEIEMFAQKLKAI